MILRQLALMGSLAALAACAAGNASPDFERQRDTQFRVPYDRPDIIYYDVKLSPEYPDNSEAAEATRMEWLQAWMEFRKMCENGFEVVERRPFRFEESNPGRYDLRYEVACKPGVEEAG